MIYITGDTHIPVDIGKLSSKRFPEQKQLTAEDFVIICGDFGGVWDGKNEELYYRKWLDGKNFTTLFVDGNHENFDMLEELPTVEFCGGKAHKIGEKIYHLMRGEVYELCGKKIFTFGGGKSHDREGRTEGKTWWQREMPSHEEMEHARQSLEKCANSVDIIITHCAPTSIQRMVMPQYENDVLTDFLEELKNKISYEKWFFGHYHVDGAVDERCVAVFDNVIDLP